MKEIYESAKMEITELELEDVITTSGEITDIDGNAGISYGGGGSGGAR